jgi:hypothetical protein
MRAIFSVDVFTIKWDLPNLFCARTIFHTMQPNYCATLIRGIVNMPKNIRQVDCCFKSTLGSSWCTGTWPYTTTATAMATALVAAQHDNQPAAKDKRHQLTTGGWQEVEMMRGPADDRRWRWQEEEALVMVMATVMITATAMVLASDSNGDGKGNGDSNSNHNNNVIAIA